MVPSEPGPVGPIGAPPTGTITIMINFDHELEDRSGKKNHAIFEFTNNQLLFAMARIKTSPLPSTLIPPATAHMINSGYRSAIQPR